MASFLSPLIEGNAHLYALVNTRTGRLVADTVLPALDARSRNRGLLGRTDLPEGHAMIIAPTHAIHTWFMKFPIDVAFVARTGDVLKTRDTVVPWRMTAAWRGYGVIEMPAGTLRRSQTRQGDRLALVLRQKS